METLDVELPKYVNSITFLGGKLIAATPDSILVYVKRGEEYRKYQELSIYVSSFYKFKDFVIGIASAGGMVILKPQKDMDSLSWQEVHHGGHNFSTDGKRLAYIKRESIVISDINTPHRIPIQYTEAKIYELTKQTLSNCKTTYFDGHFWLAYQEKNKVHFLSLNPDFDLKRKEVVIPGNESDYVLSNYVISCFNNGDCAYVKVGTTQGFAWIRLNDDKAQFVSGGKRNGNIQFGNYQVIFFNRFDNSIHFHVDDFECMKKGEFHSPEQIKDFFVEGDTGYILLSSGKIISTKLS